MEVPIRSPIFTPETLTVSLSKSHPALCNARYKLVYNFIAVRAFLCMIASHCHFGIPQFKSME